MRYSNIFLLFFSISNSGIASEFSGYFQTDHTISENPNAPKGFQLRRINLIYAKKVLDNAKLLADIEYENGLELDANGGSGEIKISRGYGEIQLNKKIMLRVGKFLTPFGIYNEIHDFSASYVPIDPLLFFRKNQFFSNDSAKRAISKYSTGIYLQYDRKKYQVQAGVANGEQQKNDGSDQNRSPLSFLRATYNFTNQSWIGMSYQRDRISTLTHLKWEENYGLDLQVENQSFIFQTEFFTGKKWNSSTDYVNTNYQSYSALFGYYVNDALVGFLRYERFMPNKSQTKYKDEEYGLGANYYLNYYTIVKWESFQETYNTQWIKNKDYITHKLSLSIVF